MLVSSAILCCQSKDVLLCGETFLAGIHIFLVFISTFIFCSYLNISFCPFSRIFVYIRIFLSYFHLHISFLSLSTHHFFLPPLHSCLVVLQVHRTYSALRAQGTSQRPKIQSSSYEVHVPARLHELQHSASTISYLMRSVFDCQSRLTGLAGEPGFMYTLFHDRPAGCLEHGTMELFDKEYALLNTLYVMCEPFYYTTQLQREITLTLMSAASPITQLLARSLNALEFAWSCENSQVKSGVQAGQWQMYKGEQRAIGELLAVGEGNARRCMGFVEFKRELLRDAPNLLAHVCASPPFWKDFEVSLESNPLRHELHKYVRQLRSATDERILPTPVRSRLVHVQHVLIDLLDLLDPDFVHFPVPQLRAKCSLTCLESVLCSKAVGPDDAK